MTFDTPVAGVVSLRTDDGETHSLIHGDVIGRLWSAALHVNDGRVSECHAMVSNRGAEMQLLALRGRFRIGGEVAREAVLAVGQRIELAPGVGLDVVEVRTPEFALAVEAPGLTGRVVAGVVSLFGSPPRLVPGWSPKAQSRLWPTGDGWMRNGEEGPLPVSDGSTWEVQGTPFTARMLYTGGVQPTEDNLLTHRLKLVNRYDAVHIHQLPAGNTLVLSGLSARLVSELALVGQPLEWHALAAELWGPHPKHLLRKRWDMQISRLRRKFRAGGVRTNLVSPDGRGLVQLVLGPQDELVDET